MQRDAPISGQGEPGIVAVEFFRLDFARHQPPERHGPGGSNQAAPADTAAAAGAPIAAAGSRCVLWAVPER